MDDIGPPRTIDEPASTNATEKPTPVYLTYKALSAKTGISLSTLRRRVKEGKLQHCQPGGKRTRVIFPQDVVERLMRTDDHNPEPTRESPPLTGGADRRSGPAPKWLRG
jgi:excisionase family DNA binding protein